MIFYRNAFSLSSRSWAPASPKDPSGANFPSLATTRWQGHSSSGGQFLIRLPTALAAPGLPALPPVRDQLIAFGCHFFYVFIRNRSVQDHAAPVLFIHMIGGHYRFKGAPPKIPPFRIHFQIYPDTAVLLKNKSKKFSVFLQPDGIPVRIPERLFPKGTGETQAQIKNFFSGAQI